MEKNSVIGLFVDGQYFVESADGTILEVLHIGVPAGMPPKLEAKYLREQMDLAMASLGITGQVKKIPADAQVEKGKKFSDYDDDWKLKEKKGK